jgi:serine protease Do/serine protease DegQ
MLENVLPAIVNISTSSALDESDNPLLSDPFYRRLFPRGRQQSSSLGSGVIVDAENGYVLTNHHVIADADEITVTTSDGRSLEAVLVGSDSDSDVAVIQVNDPNIVAIPVGRSEKLRVGDFVVAIGSPFGLNQTVTSGIVSALGRSGLGIEGYEDFIQTDASINPGNSGGALVNLRGELIGINTAILSRGGGSVGIGLSIPIDMANSLMQQLVEFGNIQRGLLGVAMQDLTADLADQFGISGTRGALVSEVIPGSAAQDVGMQSGDVIVRFNQTTVKNSADLRNAVGLLRSGDQGTVAYFRDGKLLENDVTIKSMEQFTQASLKPSVSDRLVGANFVNVEATESGRRGVRVESIEPQSPAAETGLEPGDIIVTVNKTRVRNIEQLASASKLSDDVLLVRLIRDGRPLFLVVQ